MKKRIGKPAKAARKKKLLLTLEDEECFDDWPLPAIVPVVFSVFPAKIEAECYFGVYEEVRSFLTDFAANPFSRPALEELDRRLAPYLARNGYERGGGLYRYYRSFVLWKEEDLAQEAIRPDSQMLSRQLLAGIRYNPTGFDLEELLRKDLPTALTILDGVVVSVASVNEHSPGQRLLEASVYTAAAHREKGYGASNTALLARTLLRKKRGVIYCCSCRNRASIALAKKLGFREESRFYAVDAYKTDGV